MNDDRRDDPPYGAEAPFPDAPSDWTEPGPLTPDPAPPAFPWPPPENGSVAGAFAATWQGATLQPRRFFAAMPHDLPLGAVLLYYLPLGILVAGASLFWSTAGGGISAEQDAVLESLTGGRGSLSPLVEFLLSPLLLLLQLAISAAVTHALLLLFSAAGGGFGATLSVFAFAYSPQLFAVVPWIGTPVAFVWMVVISIIGLREAHRTTTGRAAAAVLIPAVIILTLLVIAAFIAAAAGLLEGMTL